MTTEINLLDDEDLPNGGHTGITSSSSSSSENNEENASSGNAAKRD